MTQNKPYNENLSLLTDLYQLTMANAYWATGTHQQEAVFHLNYRTEPFGGNYTIACGLDLAINFLQNLQFSDEDIKYLAQLKGAKDRPLFDEEFLEFLREADFTWDIDAVPEGTLVFADEPLLRVKAPLWQAQILETPLLNCINFSTLIATKASRVVQAAQGGTVLEFGLRRAQGFDGGISEARAAYIGGCHATSNVLAGKLFGIPVKGTHAHSWVMSFETEMESFQKYAEAMPHNSIFLVDTYDTIEGVRKAIRVGEWLRERGHAMNGIRLDSGDLAQLSIEARKMLDEAGFEDTSIVASGNLDEYKIKDLLDRDAKIDIWGVGTHLATAYDEPALDGIYKLAAIHRQDDWNYQVKLSDTEAKISNPGIQQVRRMMKDGQPEGDVIYDERISNRDDFRMKNCRFNFEDGHDLLQPIFKNGERVYTSPTAQAMREHTFEQLALFANVDWTDYPIGLESNLHHEKKDIIKKLNAKNYETAR
jgi:nicotinate phosphoribosyltransferase